MMWSPQKWPKLVHILNVLFNYLTTYLVSIERAFFGTKNVVGFSTLVDLRHVRFILPYHYKYLGRVTVTISAFGICNDLWRRIQCGSHL